MTDKHSTSDIITRLRAMAADKALAIGDAWNGLDAAADEIERLRAEVADLRRINQVDGTELRALCAARDEARRERDALRARIDGAVVGFWCEAMPAYICLPKNWLEVVKPWTDGKRVALVVLDE